MDSDEAEEYVNACMRYANLNLCKYAPMIDLLGPRAQMALLDAPSVFSVGERGARARVGVLSYRR